MDKYAPMKWFNHDHWLQVHMYALMCNYTQTMTENDYFSAKKTFVEKYKKYQLQEHSYIIG